MWFSLNDAERKLVIDSLRSSKGDRPATEAEEQLAKQLEEYAAPDERDQAFRDAASDPFGANDIDDDAVVSYSDEGAYVMGWIWVSNADADVGDDEEDEDA